MYIDNILKCKICNFECKSLVTHLKHKHKMTTQQYKNIYGQDCRLYIHSEELRKKISDTLKIKNKDELFRKLNSDRQKNGASIFTKKYWIKKGFTENEAITKISEIQKNNANQSVLKSNYQNQSILCKGYWLKKGKTEEEAIECIKKHQIKASSKSSKFLGHIRTEESKKKISMSMKEKIKEVGIEKWIKHFGNFNGTSKVEIECFNYIKKNIDKNVKSNILINGYVVDIIKDKKIIEFYGDYWHCNPKIYSSQDFARIDDGKKLLAENIWKKDNIRSRVLEKLGYTILVIWENDWIKNKKECIKKIKEYLL
jgi:hypothetical protein